MAKDQTPGRSSRTQRLPASPEMLVELLRELGIKPEGRLRFRLVSRWAAKHVWRVDVNRHPWAYVRYLLGEAEQYPERWRHLRFGTLLHEARIGPRVLGITPQSKALGGRAAIVEAALAEIDRDSLEARAVEVIALFVRLHSCGPLLEALSEGLSEGDRERLQPLARLFAETRERWFEAVMARWLEVGLTEIQAATDIVHELVNRIEVLGGDREVGIIVPVHGDPNHGNFMVNRQGSLRMIDFEELALNNPVADLGMFLTWYVDKDQHRDLLTHYPLMKPDEMLERMRVWVPLRYLGIAAHWAARLTRARDEEAWVFAAESVEEWLRGAAELVFDGAVPDDMDAALTGLRDDLLAEWVESE